VVESERRYRRETFGGVNAFSGEYLVPIEDLKKTRHAPHLLVNVFLQVLVAYYTRRHLFFFYFVQCLGLSSGTAMSLSMSVALC